MDILVESLAVNSNSANESINTLIYVKEKHKGVKTTCGLSNISFGLPKRALVNSAFLTIAVANGLDSAIINNTSRTMMDTLHAALAVTGQDEYCLEYIQYVRNIEQS
jgi:5-methyltetrahydrofolate--homocysteine methyltransferase